MIEELLKFGVMQIFGNPWYSLAVLVGNGDTRQAITVPIGSILLAVVSYFLLIWVRGY